MKRYLFVLFVLNALNAEAAPPPFHSEDPGTEENFNVIYKDFATLQNGDGSISVNRASATNLLVNGTAGITGTFTLTGLWDGWIGSTATWTYISATQFSIPNDWTGILQAKDKVKLTQTTAKYFEITAVAFTASVTTVTVTGGASYTLANAAITSPFYSKVETPQAFPQAMLARFKVGVFTRDATAASESVSYTGVGFKPSSIYLMSTRSTASQAFWGVSDVANDLAMNFLPTGAFDITASASVGISDGTNSQLGEVSSFDADGFTIAWTKANSPTGTISVRYIAYR